MSYAANEKVNEVIFTAVDSIYFKKYAYAWAWSIFKNNMHGHIHVINPSIRDVKNLKKLKADTRENINFSTGDIDLDLDLPRDKCYFASFRFLYLNRLKKSYNKIIVTDVDSVIRKKFQFPEEDFGFFLRESLDSNDQWFVESTKLAAGIFYINFNTTKNFNFTNRYLEYLLIFIKQNQWKWMVDQYALYKVFLEIDRLDKFKIRKFHSTDFCWSFKKSSKIWTGKGKRKNKSKEYLLEYKKYLNEYYKASKMSLTERLLNFMDQF